jgi:hypothetical protein
MEAVAIAVDPQDPLHVLTSVGDASPFPKLSADGGHTWRDVGMELWEAGLRGMVTRARFSQGLALATQLIDAETALTAARVRRAEAEADERIAVAALRKALGLPQIESQPNTQ